VRLVKQELHPRLTGSAAKNAQRAPCPMALSVSIAPLVLSRLATGQIASKDKTVSNRDRVVLARSRVLTGGQELAESASVASQANRATLIAPIVRRALHGRTTLAVTVAAFCVHPTVWLFLCPTTSKAVHSASVVIYRVED
jgi:hypothetical protein